MTEENEKRKQETCAIPSEASLLGEAHGDLCAKWAELLISLQTIFDPDVIVC
jgi:hypothetical protein